MITLSDRGVRVRLRSFRCGDISTVGGRATFPMTTLNYAVALRPIRYWIKDMKKTLSLSALMLMTTAPVFAQDAILLEEIVVNATLTPTEAWKTASSVSEITDADVDTATSTSMNQILNSTAGFSVTQGGGAGSVTSVSLRGMTSEYFTVTRDGIDISDPSATKTKFEGFGALTTNAIESVDVLKGAQSALYGSSAIAGVVGIKTLDLENAVDGTTQSIDFGIGSNNTQAGTYKLIQRGDRLSLGLAASMFKTDGITAAAPTSMQSTTGTENTEKDGFESKSLTLSGEYQLSESIKIGATAFYQEDRADFDEFYTDDTNWVYGVFDGTTDEYSKNKTTGARVFTEINRGNWDHKIALSFFDTDRFSTSPTGATNNPDFAASTVNMKADRQTLSYLATGKISNNLTLSFGADTKQETAKGDTIVSGSKSATTTGVFVEAQYQATEKLALVANIRNDVHSDFGTFQSYRLNAAYKLSDATVIRGSVAQSYRAPALSELYGIYEGSYPTDGNPDLKPETFTSFELGVDHYFAGGAKASLVMYETEFKDRINWAYGFPRSTYENAAGAHAKGAEFALSLPMTSATTVDVAFSNNKILDTNGARLGRAAGTTSVVTLSHAFNDALSTKAQIVSASDHAQSSIEDYTVFNVSANYKLSDTMELYGNVENLSDYKYSTQSGYSMPGRTVFAGIRASF